MPKKLTKEQVLRRFRIAHGWKYEYDFSTYKNTHAKMKIICPVHGEFWQTPDAHMSKIGCNKCGRKVAGRKIRLSEKDFIERVKIIHNNKYDYSKVKYELSSEKVIVICPKHGEFLIKPVQHLSGHGCKICGREQANSKTRSSIEVFIQKANKIHNFKYDYTKAKYVSNKTKLEIICPKHGNFWQTPHGHLSGKGCASCYKRKTQNEIFCLLKQNFPNENWVWEYRSEWLGLQSIDIVNERIKLAIEYNGEQHYMPVKIFGGEEEFEKTKNRDIIKEEKIRNNGYNLYIIPYNEYNKKKIINDIKTFLNYENSEI